MARPRHTARLACLAAFGCAVASAHETAPLTAAAAPAATAAVVEIDKAQQQVDGIRTLTAQALPAQVSIPAEVIADPRYAVRITATQDGVVRAPASGLPLPGTPVQAGAALLVLQQLVAATERSDLHGEQAEVERDEKIGALQIERYHVDRSRPLDVQLPTPSLQILVDYRSALARHAALSTALDGSVQVSAPRAGVVLRSLATAGSVVTAGTPLLELAGRGALALAADYADDDIDADSAATALTADGRRLSVRFLASAYDASRRAHRAVYALPVDSGLSAGEPVMLQFSRTTAATVVTLPSTSLVRVADRRVVWLHTAAERFEARPVEGRNTGPGLFEVDQGLSGGERVVVAGVGALTASAHP